MAAFRSFLWLSFLVLSVYVLSIVDSVQFRKRDFRRGDGGLQYQGDASPNGVVEITNYNYVCRVGWVTYAERVPLWNPSTGQTTDFTTTFSFRIDTRGSKTFGHGVAFFIAPEGIQIPPNSAGGFLGLLNDTNTRSSLYPLVFVEFDSYRNVEWDPLDVQSHVGINNNSLISSVYTAWNTSLHSRDVADVRITYNASTRNLSASWQYQTTSDSRENSSLHYIIDLSRVLPAWVTVGVSAATGSGLFREEHRLISWEFSSSLQKSEKKSKNMTRVIIGVSISAAILVLLLIVASALFLRKTKKRKAALTTSFTSINADLERGAGPRNFPYQELSFATNNFSEERKLGEGGFGAVYKGYLMDLDTMVAVKKILGSSRQGKKEYVTEIKVISSLRHRNLVQLIGWCHETGKFLLVYEFMPNGSLDTHLFGKRSHLRWSIRYKITLGLASALLYLHEEWEQCVLHRDIKASNIMLDSNFQVKLGDFGLARLMDHEVGTKTTGLAGTLGYMAPEYIKSGRASKESDVFSFGVVLLEIATGRKAVGSGPSESDSEASLVELVWQSYGMDDILSQVDERLVTEFNAREAECMMIVGLWCAHPDRSSRPSIRQAIQVLNLEAPVPRLPGKMPVPTYQGGSMSSGSSSKAAVTFTSAEVGR